MHFRKTEHIDGRLLYNEELLIVILHKVSIPLQLVNLFVWLSEVAVYMHAAEVHGTLYQCYVIVEHYTSEMLWFNHIPVRCYGLTIYQ